MSGGRWSDRTRSALVFVGLVLVTLGVLATIRFQSDAGAAALVAGGLAVGLAGMAGSLTFSQASRGTASSEARLSAAAEAQQAGDTEGALDRFVHALRLYAPENADYHEAATQAMYQAAGRAGEQLRPLYGFLLSPLSMSGSLVLVDVRGGTGFSLTRMQTTYQTLLVGPPAVFDAVLVVLNAPVRHSTVDAVEQLGTALDRPVVAVGWRVGDDVDALLAGIERIRAAADRRAGELGRTRVGELDRARPAGVGAPPGLSGTVPPGLSGTVPPGLSGTVPPGLSGPGGRDVAGLGSAGRAEMTGASGPTGLAGAPGGHNGPAPVATPPRQTFGPGQPAGSGRSALGGPHAAGLAGVGRRTAVGTAKPAPVPDDRPTVDQAAVRPGPDTPTAGQPPAPAVVPGGPTAAPPGTPADPAGPAAAPAVASARAQVPAPAQRDSPDRQAAVEPAVKPAVGSAGVPRQAQPVTPPGRTALSAARPAFDDNGAWRRATELHWQGQLQDAEAAYRDIIGIRVEAIGADHPDTLAARDQHATVLRDLDRLNEALAECEDVLAARTRSLGQDHPDTLTSRSHLATIYHQLGELSQAEAEHTRVLHARTRVLGSTHQETLISRSNLAKVHQDLGELDRAVDEHRQVLDARARLLGAEHRDTLMSRSLLASALHQAGRLEEAEAQHRRVLRSRLRLLGPVHLDTAVSRHRLASVLHDINRLNEAIAEYRAAYDIYSELLGAGSPFARAAASDLAMAERAAARGR